MPLIRKPLPVTVAWRMVRSALPELIRVADWVMLAPIFTLPRARLAGETASCPPPIPVPVTGALTLAETVFKATVVNWPSRSPNVSGRRGAFSAIVPNTAIVPLALPPAAGVKLTLIVTLSPCFRVCGKVSPVRVNPFPVVAA